MQEVGKKTIKNYSQAVVNFKESNLCSIRVYTNHK